MTEGYIFTENTHAVFDAYTRYDEIRYAAGLDDHTGFAAFDEEHPSFKEFGEVRTVKAFIWPWAAPKRGVKQGDEWYARLPREDAIIDELVEMPQVSAVCELDDGTLLIESHGPTMLLMDGMNARVRWAQQRRTTERMTQLA